MTVSRRYSFTELLSRLGQGGGAHLRSDKRRCGTCVRDLQRTRMLQDKSFALFAMTIIAITTITFAIANRNHFTMFFFFIFPKMTSFKRKKLMCDLSSIVTFIFLLRHHRQHFAVGNEYDTKPNDIFLVDEAEDQWSRSPVPGDYFYYFRVYFY